MTQLTATGLDGSTVQLTKETVDAFRTRLRGRLLLQGDPGYDDARRVWNGMVDRRPALVAQPTGTADVVACVNLAREHGLLLSIKGGGHNIAGLAVADGALMLDMGRMRGVRVDPEARTAWAQAGCILGDVDRETQVHGLAAVLGFVSETGIAGLTLGGGFGYLTRRFGWTVDNLRSVEVVTVDGQVVTAGRDRHADLFWGLCGGGGNFGVATAFEFELHQVGPQIVGGAIAWPGEDAAEVLAFLRKFAADAPEELTCVGALRRAPPAPWLPKEHHGKFVAMVIVCHSGDLAEGERLVAPLKAFRKPIGDVIMRRPYTQQQTLLDATQPKGRRYYWKSEYLPRLEPDACATLLQHAQSIPSPHSAVFLFQLSGAVGRLPEDANATGNRNAGFVLNIASAWEDAKDDEANLAWARATHKAMRGYSTGGVYVNFLTEEEGDPRIHSAYGKNYDRLARLKHRYDPENRFRVNKNIAPLASSG